SSRPNGSFSRSYSGRSFSSMSAEVQISSGSATARDSMQVFANFIPRSACRKIPNPKAPNSKKIPGRKNSFGTCRFFGIWTFGIWDFPRWHRRRGSHCEPDDFLIEIIRAQPGVDDEGRAVDPTAAPAEQEGHHVGDLLRF